MAKDTKDTKDVKTKLTREVLACKLTDAERADKHGQVMQTLREHDQIESEKKSAVAGFKARLTANENKLNELRGIIDRGDENRAVDVQIELDYKTKEVRKRRLDTGEVYESRVMTEGELQVSLLPDDKAPGAKPSKGEAKSIDDAAGSGAKKPRDVAQTGPVDGFKLGPMPAKKATTTATTSKK